MLPHITTNKTLYINSSTLKSFLRQLRLTLGGWVLSGGSQPIPTMTGMLGTAACTTIGLSTGQIHLQDPQPLWPHGAALLDLPAAIR